MKKKSILRLIKIFNLCLITLFLIITIFQISILTDQIHFVTQAEKKIKQLSKENQLLEEKLLNSNSLSNLEEFVKRENLVRGEKIKFIQILGGAVLAK